MTTHEHPEATQLEIAIVSDDASVRASTADAIKTAVEDLLGDIGYTRKKEISGARGWVPERDPTDRHFRKSRQEQVPIYNFCSVTFFLNPQRVYNS
jgi:hypothetical protein